MRSDDSFSILIRWTVIFKQLISTSYAVGYVQQLTCNFKVRHLRCVCKHEYNVTSSQNKNKFICFCWYTNITTTCFGPDDGH